MKLVFSWDTAQANGSLFRGWQMNDLLVELLKQEAAKTCDQCSSDCTHGAAEVMLAERKRQGPHWFWDNEAKKGWSYMGFQPNHLLVLLLQQAADEACSKFCGAWCVHEAAREVLATKKRIHEKLQQQSQE